MLKKKTKAKDSAASPIQKETEETIQIKEQ